MAYFVMSFNDFDGVLVASPNDLNTAKLGVSINADSLETGSDHLTMLLKSKSFFNASNCKLITFSSTKIADGLSPGANWLTGDLMIIDKRHHVQFKMQTFYGDPIRSESRRLGMSIVQEMALDELQLNMVGFSHIDLPLKPDRIAVYCDLEFERQANKGLVY